MSKNKTKRWTKVEPEVKEEVKVYGDDRLDNNEKEDDEMDGKKKGLFKKLGIGAAIVAVAGIGGYLAGHFGKKYSDSDDTDDEFEDRDYYDASDEEVVNPPEESEDN